jgi:hypothetical protein
MTAEKVKNSGYVCKVDHTSLWYIGNEFGPWLALEKNIILSFGGARGVTGLHASLLKNMSTRQSSMRGNEPWIFCSLLRLPVVYPGNVKSEREVMRLCPDFGEASRLLFYAPGGRSIQLLDIADGQMAKMELPFNIR